MIAAVASLLLVVFLSPEHGPASRVGLRLHTFDNGASGAAEGAARPIRAVVTYPGAGGGAAWTFRELVRETCGDNLSTVPSGPTHCVERQLAQLAEFRPERTPQEHQSALDVPLTAHHGVVQAAGRHPVIVFDGGLTSDALSYLSLMEHLSAAGYICVSLPSVPFAPGRPLTFDLHGVESKARDVAFVIDSLDQLAGADASRVGVAAWSVGGLSTLLAAISNERVRALVSLDGGLGYEYGPPLVQQSVLYQRGARTPAVLHLTGAVPNPFPVPKDSAFLRSLANAEVFLATVDGWNHSHFVSAGGSLPFAADRQSAAGVRFWRGHAAVAATTAAFLDATVRRAVPSAELVDIMGQPRRGITIARVERAPTSQPPVAGQACLTERHREFDFWIGNWLVALPDGRPAGRNSIERVANGCGLQESWTDADGKWTGRSVTGYSTRDGRWHQTWIGSGGDLLHMIGGRQGERMIMEGDAIDSKGVPVRQRTTWSPLPDGRVRHLTEYSRDAGATWTVVFNALYTRAGAAPAGAPSAAH